MGPHLFFHGLVPLETLVLFIHIRPMVSVLYIRLSGKARNLCFGGGGWDTKNEMSIFFSAYTIQAYIYTIYYS